VSVKKKGKKKEAKKPKPNQSTKRGGGGIQPFWGGKEREKVVYQGGQTSVFEMAKTLFQGKLQIIRGSGGEPVKRGYIFGKGLTTSKKKRETMKLRPRQSNILSGRCGWQGGRACGGRNFPQSDIRVRLGKNKLQVMAFLAKRVGLGAGLNEHSKKTEMLPTKKKKKKK